MNKFGIDVSQHQGTIDWSKVKSKVDFAILRLGWIGNKENHTLDTKFEENYKNAKANGVKVGVYVYNYCNSEDTAKSGANWATEKLKGKILDLPVYIDMEDSSIKSLGKEKLTNIAIAFNTIIENAGYWAGVYANKDWFTNYLNKDTLSAKYTCWVAQYASKCTLTMDNIDIWQNSSAGSINGINGNVDTNYMYRDLISDISGTSTTVTTTQSTKSIVDLANEVIAGKYGTGEDRKKALGSLYDEVQAKVNEIMASKTTSKEVTYKVKSGDTLSAIAKKYNTTVTAIAKKNSIKDVNKIYVGQVLKI